MRWLCYPVLVLWVIGGAWADVSEFRKSDPRLDKKVSLAVNHVKLEDVAQSLAEQSGVDIKAGTGKRDWKVRERKVTIHAKDIQVGQVLEEISRLTGYHVSRLGKQGEWNYLIWQDQKGRIFEEEMLVAAKEAEARRTADIRQGTLDAAAKALRISPEQALKNRDKDPLGAYLGGTQSGRGFAQFLSSLQSMFPTEYGLMMRGKRVAIPVSGLPPGLQGAVADIMSGGLATWMGKNVKGQELVPQQFVLEASRGQDREIQQMLGFGGMILLNAQISGQQNAMPTGVFPMSSPDSKLGGLFGKLLLSIDEGMDLNEANKQANDQFQGSDAMAELLARKSPTEENPPTDPELLKEIEIKEVTGALRNGPQPPNQAEEYGKMIAEVARATGKSVLVESYDSAIPISTFLKTGKQPFYKVLVAAEKAGCRWEMGEGTLRIRPEDWAIFRSREVAESFLKHYKELLQKNGAFTLEDLAGLVASLTDDQLEGGVLADKDLSPAVITATTNRWGRNMLRAYGTMDPNQKSQLWAEGGMSFGQLTDAQWLYVNDIITDEMGGAEIMDGSVRIVPDPPDKPNPNRKIFEITVITPREEKPHPIKVWVTTPTQAYVKDMMEQRKKQQEAMEKAAKEKAEAAK